MKNTTAARLQQVMNERNLKQVDVISLSKVHQKELGVLLARTLGVSEAWLMGYDVPMAKEQPQSQPNAHDIDNIIDNAMMFDGKPLTDEDKRAIRGIIAGYMSSKGD